jgi:ATP-dependent DNA helicase RecG
MFDDRMEIRSPGLPPHPVTVAALNRRERLHISRNPLMVRVLADLGYMQELGEGIPRMFEEMERQGFYPPLFEDIGGVSFQVKFRNQPVYDRATLEWLQGFQEQNLSGDQKRILAYAHAHNEHFSSRDYQKLTGLDIYSASNSIKDLIRKGVVRSIRKRGRTYEVVKSEVKILELPEGLKTILPILVEKGCITNAELRPVLGLVSRATAHRLLRHWCETGYLQKKGEKRWRVYTPGPKLMHHLTYASCNQESDA